jgi:hypothetical protein
MSIQNLFGRYTSIRLTSVLTIFLFVLLLSNKPPHFSDNWKFHIIPYSQEILLPAEDIYFMPDQETRMILDGFADSQDSFDVIILYDFFQMDEINPLKISSASIPLDSNNRYIFSRRS